MTKLLSILWSNQWTRLLSVSLLVGALSFGAGYYSTPEKVVVKKEIQEVIKEVERVKTDVVVVEKETKSPDGTVVVERRTEEKTSRESKSNTAVNENSLSQTETGVQPEWRLGVKMDFKEHEFVDYVDSITIERRMLGPIWAGVSVDQSRTISLAVSWEF